MKVLLIKVRVPKRKSFLFETNVTGIYPPLGLGYIASVLRKEGYTVNLLDLEVFNLRAGSFLERVKLFSPEVVLFSTTTLNWPEVVKKANLIKRHFPHILVGVGGPHISIYPLESLSQEAIDFGIYGEGELTLLEALRRIAKKKDLDGIAGCIYRKEHQVVMNPPRKEIEDLDKIPYPAIDLLPYRRYFAFTVRHPFFTMVTTRGCPYKCKFCFQGYLGKYRSRSPENVVQEIDILINKYGIKEVIIFDETFAIEKERVLKICELINKKRLKFKWDIRTRVDLLNKEVLQALKKAGCYRLNIGIESGSDKILERMNKGFSISLVRERLGVAKNLGFDLRGYFMLAYPGETYETILTTIKFARLLPLDWASFTVTIALPATEIYEDALRGKYFHFDYWREYTQGNFLNRPPYFIPQGLKEEDLFRLKRSAYFKFYFRPAGVWSLVRGLKSMDTVKNLTLALKLLPRLYYSTTQV